MTLFKKTVETPSMAAALCRWDVEISSQDEAAIERHAGTEKQGQGIKVTDVPQVSLHSNIFFREFTSPLDDKNLRCVKLTML